MALPTQLARMQTCVPNTCKGTWLMQSGEALQKRAATGGQQLMPAILYEKCISVDSPLSCGLNSCVHIISRSTNA